MNQENPILIPGNPAQQLIFELRYFAGNRLNSYLYDGRKCISPLALLEMGNKGFFGLNTPLEYQGLGMGNHDICCVMEQLGSIDISLATLIINNNFLGIRPLIGFASESIKTELLPGLAAGRHLASYALTEPEAGSNPLNLKGRGVIGNGYCRINAEKMWIGSASWASVINTFVHTETASGTRQGITCYSVPVPLPGLKMGEELMTMGMRAMVQNKIYYHDVLVPERFMLGEPGQGMTVAHDAMMYTRLAFGASFLGSMKRCLQLMHRYSERRHSISTGRLMDHPVTLERITSIMAMCDLLESAVAVSARQLDQKQNIPQEMYITCKVAGSEFLWQTVDMAMQALGGRGYLENNVLPQIMRDARVTRIFEGPTETLLAYMGNKLIRGGAEPEVLRFMEEQAGSSEALDLLRKVMNECRRIIAGNSRLINHVSYLCGELVMWALLLNAAGNRINQMSSDYGLHQMRTRWAALCSFEECTSKLVMKADEVDLRMERIYGSIGDIEQELPGEDLLLDPYLRNNRASQAHKENNPDQPSKYLI